MEGNRATTTIWNWVLVADPVKATGPLQSGNPRFFIWGQVQLEGDGATTAVWELLVVERRQGCNANLVNCVYLRADLQCDSCFLGGG